MSIENRGKFLYTGVGKRLGVPATHPTHIEALGGNSATMHIWHIAARMSKHKSEAAMEAKK